MNTEAMIETVEQELEMAQEELATWQYKVKMLNKKLKDLRLCYVDEQNGLAA